MRQPTRFLAILLLPTPLLAASPADLARSSLGVARTGVDHVADAGRKVLHRSQGDGATGVARTARFAVLRTDEVQQATRTTAANLRLSQMKRAHAAGQESLAKIGQVRAPLAPKTSQAPAPSVTLGRAVGATTRAAPSLTRTALQGAALAKAATASPAARQFTSPFRPGNVLFAVGATAGFHILHQLRDPEQDVDLGGALSFVQDKAFWGGMLGSAVSYGMVAGLTATLIPAGAGITVAMAPMLAGMVASVVGWELGAAVIQGENPLDTLKSMSAGRVLGQAGGTTVGLALGANLGGVLGGTLGSVAGPLGAVGGALLLGTLGAEFGEKLSGAAGSAMSGDLDGAVASVQAAETTISTLRLGITSDYQGLQTALESGDRLAALERLESLRRRSEALSTLRAAP